MSEVRSRNPLSALVLAIVLLSMPVTASADQVFQLFGAGDGSLGLDVGFICDVGVPSCSGAQNYNTIAPFTFAASGTLVVDDATTQVLSLDITLPNMTLDLVPGGTQYGTVDEIRFTSLTVSVNPFPVFAFGTQLFPAGLVTATVSGSYTQWSSGIEVAGPDVFSINNVALTGFACDLIGLCGLGVGASGDLILTEIGDITHNSQELNMVFNLAVVPEPGTGLLVMIGLTGLALRRRR